MVPEPRLPNRPSSCLPKEPTVSLGTASWCLLILCSGRALSSLSSSHHLGAGFFSCLLRVGGRKALKVEQI